METEGQLIKSALGSDWNLLSEKIRKRFEYEPEPNHPKFYSGEMLEVKCSAFGKYFAYLARMLKAPLIPYNYRNVPIKVEVYKKTGGLEIYKRRTYYFEKKQFTVQSAMSFDQKNGFIEFVNPWLGMKLKVFSEKGNLYFKATSYFIKLSNWLIPIPLFLTPGIAYIEHSDHDNDAFRVKIEMIHPWFGLIFFQDGIFKEVNL